MLLLARRLLVTALVGLACSSDDSGDDTVADDGKGSSSNAATEESGAASADAGACMDHEVTLEGCGINGCEAGPTNLHGTVPAGGACAMVEECAPSLCACPDDATIHYFGGDCACGLCADETVACDQSAGAACP